MLARRFGRNVPLVRRAQRAFLHYAPTEGRDREPIRDPQPLGQWYEYRIIEDFIPDRQAEAVYVEPPNPYVMAQMFEYDNWHFEEPHEYLAAGPLFLKPLAILFPFVVLAMLASIDSKHAREGNWGTFSPHLHAGQATLAEN